jgi:hypothetical protein
MKEPKKTYVGAAVYFERLPDDEWPEDSGQWPERAAGRAVREANWPDDSSTASQGVEHSPATGE